VVGHFIPGLGGGVLRLATKGHSQRSISSRSLFLVYAFTSTPSLAKEDVLLHNATVKLLQFPKPPPLHTLEHTISISIGADRYTMKIHAEIEHFTGPDPSTTDSQCAKLQFPKLVPGREGGDRDGDRSTDEDGSSAEVNTGAKSEILRNDTATAQSPVATFGAQRPNVASRVGKAGRRPSGPKNPRPAKPPARGAPVRPPSGAKTVAEPEVVASIGAPVADAAPGAAKATKKAIRTKKEPTGETNVKVAREGSKTNQAITMMKRPGGATLKQLMEAFGWQAHTVRGFVAGALTKKLGLTVTSTKPQGGDRTYSISS
jgi:hypothetical protein